MTAAKTPDGTLAVVYKPVSDALSIGLDNLTARVTARWYDGTFMIIQGSRFPNTGTYIFTTRGNMLLRSARLRLGEQPVI